MLDPIQRRQYGVTSLLLSIVFLSVSAAAGVGNAIQRNSVAEEIDASEQECETRIKLLGASSVTKSEHQIVAEWNGLEGGYSLIGDASAAAMACPGWTMRSFCMGQECNNAGAKLELGKTL